MEAVPTNGRHPPGQAARCRDQGRHLPGAQTKKAAAGQRLFVFQAAP